MNRRKPAIVLSALIFFSLIGVVALLFWKTTQKQQRDQALLNAFRREDTWKQTWMNTDKHTQEIVALLDDGANPNLRQSGQQPLLILAIEMGNDFIAHALLEHVANPNSRRLTDAWDIYSETNIRDSDYTALSLAINLEREQIMDDLLAHGADPNARYGDGFTPLIIACMGKHNRYIKTLIAKGADVNAATPAGRLTALMLAARSGNVETATALVAAGADVNAKNHTGKSVLQYAQTNSSMIDLLKQHGAHE